jgi:hypothetical protein
MQPTRGRPQALAPRPLTEAHPSRLDPQHPLHAEICRRHAQALEHGERGYLDPQTGFFVMTAKYLADRGFCCENGCRHCPYVT